MQKLKSFLYNYVNINVGVHDILLNGNSVYEYLSTITVFLKKKISIIIYIDISMYINIYENNIILRIGQAVQQ